MLALPYQVDYTWIRNGESTSDMDTKDLVIPPNQPGLEINKPVKYFFKANFAKQKESSMLEVRKHTAREESGAAAVQRLHSRRSNSCGGRIVVCANHIGGGVRCAGISTECSPPQRTHTHRRLFYSFGPLPRFFLSSP